MAADLTLDLPAAAGTTGDCLKLTGSNVLGFGGCGTSGGWALSGTELSPVDTQVDLRLVRSAAGQGIGSFAKPWSGVWSTSFQVPDAAATGAKVNLTGSALTGLNSSGTTKVQISFNAGTVTVWDGYIENKGVLGTNTDAYAISKDASLGSNNVRWTMSQRSDGRQLWFYGYDGTNFWTTLKLNPTGNSVCISCTGDAAAGYSLDVNGQIISTGLKANGNTGYVNAPYLEVRDPSTNFHWGMQSRVDITGERSMTIRGPDGEDVLKLWTMQVGSTRLAAYLYGDLEIVGDILPDVDAGFSSGRALGSQTRRWYESHMRALYVNNLGPRVGFTDINLLGSLYPIGSAINIGNSGARVNSIYVTNLDVSSCTGCTGGSSAWTQSGLSIYPTSTTPGTEVGPRPGVTQSLASISIPWNGVFSTSYSAVNTGVLRGSLVAGGVTLFNASGIQKANISSSTGDIESDGGGVYVYTSSTAPLPSFSVNTAIIQHTGLSGAGNASVCVDTNGQFYRGTPGC
jgi:hypothetical protein